MLSPLQRSSFCLRGGCFIAGGLRTNTPGARCRSSSETVQFSGLLDEHRRQFSGASGGHANPVDAVGKLHKNLPSLNTKADLEFEFVIDSTEQPVNFARGKHFLCGHRISPPKTSSFQCARPPIKPFYLACA